MGFSQARYSNTYTSYISGWLAWKFWLNFVMFLYLLRYDGYWSSIWSVGFFFCLGWVLLPLSRYRISLDFILKFLFYNFICESSVSYWINLWFMRKNNNTLSVSKSSAKLSMELHLWMRRIRFIMCLNLLYR